MIASTRSIDLRERSSILGGKARRAFKMPILSELSRRFHMLTTDAKPDPPRTRISDYTHNLAPTQEEEEESKRTRSKSTSATPNGVEVHEREDVTSVRRQKSVPNDATPTSDFYAKSEHSTGQAGSTNESRDYKRPKTKTKTKHSKFSQGTNVVNYNIVNSNGVKIGSRTSYICNVNQHPASNNTSAQSEASWSKPKYRSMPENVEELNACEEELAFEDMFIIKTHVGHGWRNIARRLSYSDGQIEQFEENYKHRGIDEVIYQLLLDWKQVKTRDAQLGTLIGVLWSCQEYDCVERLVAARENSS